MSGRFDIPLEWYGVFCEVAKAGNMTAAAEALHISQPAVSMAVRQLEEKLGHPLFKRGARGVSMTAEGEMLRSYLEKAMGLIAAAERKYEDMARLEAGRIAIGASDTLCSRYLLPYLERYNALYPNVAVKVTNRTSAETLAILQSGGVDFGFVNLPVETDPGVEVTECLRIHDCLVCGSRYEALSKSGMELRDIGAYPLLMLERASATRRFLDAWAAGQGAALNPIIELGSSDLLVRFARINMGLAFVIREFSQEFIDGETLFEVRLSPPPPERAVGMARLRNIPLSYAAEKFIGLLR